MAGRENIYEKLSKRERQILDIILKLGKASASEVLENLSDPPSYSSVRALLTIMVNKGYLKYYQEGRKYIYTPSGPKDRERLSILRKVVNNFFEGSPHKAISSILNFSSKGLSPKDFRELRKLIEEAERNQNG